MLANGAYHSLPIPGFYLDAGVTPRHVSFPAHPPVPDQPPAIVLAWFLLVTGGMYIPACYIGWFDEGPKDGIIDARNRKNSREDD